MRLQLLFPLILYRGIRDQFAHPLAHTEPGNERCRTGSGGNNIDATADTEARAFVIVTAAAKDHCTAHGFAYVGKIASAAAG